MLEHMRGIFATRARGFLAETSGVVAVIFALSIPMVIGAAGIAVDLAQAYNIKSRLGDALDKAGLAAGSMAGDDDEVEEKVERFFHANYPADKLGTPYNFYVNIGDDSIVTVSASARVDTTFMAVLGIEEINVSSETQVMRELRGLEVVMVLDNTGSMSTNNNIATLRTASTNFINILFDAVSDPSDIKIGMVPYSSSVRIACWGRGQNYNPVTGSCSGTYNGGATFITLPSGVSATTNRNSSSGWYGCVIDHKSTNYNASATHVSGSYGQLWRTGTNCSNSTNCRGHGWDPGSGSNDPYPNDIPDSFQGPWDIYMYGTMTTNCSGTCTPKYTFNKDSMPNRYCPYANLIPLTSDQTFLLNNVSTMQADGATLSNTGMAWGYRVLSPDAPFTEGVDWGDTEWRKAVLMMTDGETSMGGNYTTYWVTSKNNIGNATLDDRLLETCSALKEQGVVIYTVTFAAGVPAATKEAYRECATTESYYFDAPSQQDLIDTFEEIARQLSNLRIIK